MQNAKAFYVVYKIARILYMYNTIYTQIFIIKKKYEAHNAAEHPYKQVNCIDNDDKREF